MPTKSSKPPGWSDAKLRHAIEAAGVALWSWNVDTDKFTMDERGYDLWGVPVTEFVTFEDLSSHIHPADRDRVRAAFFATRAIAGLYEIDFRIMVGEVVRWVSARGQGEDVGMVRRVMLGIFLDVTGRKQAEEGHELLAGEMSHRVKNLLAIASGLTAITSRSTTTATEMAKELTNRLTALGRAHDLVRPLPGKEGKAALLGDLVAVLLAPYDDMGAFSGRVRVSVPRMGVGEGQLRPSPSCSTNWRRTLSNTAPFHQQRAPLMFHVLDKDDYVIMTWTERGGPTVVAPEGSGYGSKLVGRVMATDLSGTVVRDWSPDGAIITLQMKKSLLAS